jgi:hypothetical protein
VLSGHRNAADYSKFSPATFAFFHLARARIAASAKARWAKFRAAKGEVAPKKRRKVSATARAKLAAAARAAADMRRFFFRSLAPATGSASSPLPPAIESISPCSFSIRSSMARPFARVRTSQPYQKPFNETFNDFFNIRVRSGYAAG